MKREEKENLLIKYSLQIGALNQLLKKGLITNDEYEKIKQALKKDCAILTTW